MATISVGNIKFNWKGPWGSGTTYSVDDVVSHSGSSYISIQAGSNQNPASASAYWQQMSSAGTNGTNGTDLSSTLSTRGDLVYKGASALERLPKGTSGYFLKQGSNDPEWAEAPSGKVLQTKRATTTSVVQSSNNTGGKHFPNNRGSSDGAQVVSVSITPLSTTSHFYVWFTSASGAGGNAVSVLGIYCGSTLLNITSGNNYAADVCGISVHGIQDTTSLSGAQTIQARNLGCHDGSQHGVNAGGGGNTYNGGIATMTVMEIED